MVHGRLSLVEEQMKQHVSTTADGLSDEIGEVRDFAEKLIEQKRQMGSRLHPDAHGMVDQNEFSEWAKVCTQMCFCHAM